MNAREQIEHVKNALNIVHDNGLAEILEVRPQVLAQWVLRDKISKDGVSALIKLGFNRELFGNNPKNNRNQQQSNDAPMAVSKITDCDSQVEVLQAQLAMQQSKIKDLEKELNEALIKADAFENLVVRLSGGQTQGKSTPSPKTLGDGQTTAGTNVAA